jgi:lariat debranching enzyme
VWPLLGIFLLHFPFIFSVILFCLAAVIFPLGFSMAEIGGRPYQLPNSFTVGFSYIFFVLALWTTVISELFARRVCLPHF